ncbi:MAG: hypothetical protein WD602_04890, partial [Actinomycetota bacterium]
MDPLRPKAPAPAPAPEKAAEVAAPEKAAEVAAREKAAEVAAREKAAEVAAPVGGCLGRRTEPLGTRRRGTGNNWTWSQIAAEDLLRAEAAEPA